VILVTTPIRVFYGEGDVVTGDLLKGGGTNVSSTITNNNVLRVLDGNRNKLANKNNIINGTTNNSYQTNLTNQQLHSSLQELNNNSNNNNNKNVVKENGGKLKQSISLTSIFNQFADIVTLEDGDDQNENQISTFDRKNAAVQISLSSDFASKDPKSKWEAILYSNNLYLQIPANCLVETSKEAFVNLLEYAEEELKCQNVVLCLDKSCVEKSNNLIRMFMYFGFYALSPSHPLTPQNASDSLLFMAYSFE